MPTLTLEGRADLGYPVAVEFPIELSKDSQDVNDEVVMGRGADLRRGDDDQVDPPLAKFLQEDNAVDDVSREAVQAVDENPVELPSLIFARRR